MLTIKNMYAQNIENTFVCFIYSVHQYKILWYSNVGHVLNKAVLMAVIKKGKKKQSSINNGTYYGDGIFAMDQLGFVSDWGTEPESANSTFNVIAAKFSTDVIL